MKKNNSPEMKLVNSFEKYCNQNNDFTFIHKETGKQANHMDVECTYNNEYIRLEAKAKTSNFYQAVLLIFGDILKGRELSLANNNYNYKVSYGILIPEANEIDFKKQWENISKKDWKSFGEKYNVCYVIVCDVNKSDVNIYDWKNYI